MGSGRARRDPAVTRERTGTSKAGNADESAIYWRIAIGRVVSSLLWLGRRPIWYIGGGRPCGHRGRYKDRTNCGGPPAHCENIVNFTEFASWRFTPSGGCPARPAGAKASGVRRPQLRRYRSTFEMMGGAARGLCTHWHGDEFERADRSQRRYLNRQPCDDPDQATAGLQPSRNDTVRSSSPGVDVVRIHICDIWSAQR